jgi:hypothetical protein
MKVLKVEPGSYWSVTARMRREASPTYVGSFGS